MSFAITLTKRNEEKIMTILNVPGMHCENCVNRINKALTEADLTFEVSLENRTVSIDGCDHCVATAIEELDDLGFEATKAEA